MEKYKPTGRVENIFGDNIAFVEYYEQFAYANSSEASRIEAVTNIASVCYQNPKAFGSESLYRRLECESKGLPSSSFEFIPMLFKRKEIASLYYSRTLLVSDNNFITKFGEWICNGEFLLTNFRAVTYLFEEYGIDLRKHFNTEEECNVIKKHFAVFSMYIDMPTRSQFVRHRVNLQELSRRYVSGKKTPFHFYISEKMKNIVSTHSFVPANINLTDFDYKNRQISETMLPVQVLTGTRDLIDGCLEHYEEALRQGVKPEEARRIIPQAAYTQLWSGFQPTQIENFMKLRLDEHSQWEIRKVAEAMTKLMGA
jgi:thymidylate synthase (FAD)